MAHGETLQVPLDRPAAKAPFRLVLPWDLAGDQPSRQTQLVDEDRERETLRDEEFRRLGAPGDEERGEDHGREGPEGREGGRGDCLRRSRAQVEPAAKRFHPSRL